MRAELVDYLTVKHNTELIEIEDICFEKSEQNSDYIDLEINSVKMTLSKEDFNTILEQFFD